VFEMAAPIRSTAKYEVRSVVRFLNAKGKRPAEIHNPSYSPDLAPSDFHLFLHLKKHLAGKIFDDDDEVQEEACSRANFTFTLVVVVIMMMIMMAIVLIIILLNLNVFQRVGIAQLA
jgi:hypothetical protein